MSEKAIKSVRRVFEILELFDRERRPLPAKEISKVLGYPLTSTHALLKSMEELGYADFDAPSWSYMPSSNFAALLEWVREGLVREIRILDYVNALSRETKETINISRRINTKIRIIHGVESVHSVGVSVKVGTMMPATGSLTGISSLSSFSETELSEFLEHMKSSDPGQARGVKPKLIAEILEDIRNTGCVTRCDVFIQGIGAVCVPVRTEDDHSTLVIGVVGPSDRILANQSKYRRAVKRLASQYNVRTVQKLRNPR